MRGSEDWEVLWRDDQFDAAGDARLSADQALAFEGDHHVVDARRSDLEMSLHIGFGRWASVDLGIGPDEGEVLALLVGEAGRGRAIMVKQLIHC